MPHALITGASGGVGQLVAARLLSCGWSLTAQYRTTPGDLAPQEALTWWQADFAAGKLTVPEVPERLDALIHCAGVAPIGTSEELPRVAWEESLAVNLHAPVELTAALLPQLRAAGGHIIYLNSGAGWHSHPRWSAYSAAKHAARAWCDALRAEEPQLRVTSVYPGRIATAMQREIVAELGETWNESHYLRADTVAEQVVAALNTPPDAQLNDVILRPRN